MEFTHPVDRDIAEAACRAAGLEGEDLRTAVDVYCSGRTDGPEGGRVTAAVEAHARPRAHVQIRQGDYAGTLRVMVNGVDLTDHVYTEGFGLVKVGGDSEYGEWGVQMIVAADTLDVDLPNAVIEAMRGSEEQE